MSCNCHGKTGKGATRVLPYDQCTMCAKKHIVKAWNLYNEFTYTDDNRDVISGQLRLAADHMMYEHRETALMARNLAILIEEFRDGELDGDWERLLAAVRKVFNEDHPEIRQRQERLIGERE